MESVERKVGDAGACEIRFWVGWYLCVVPTQAVQRNRVFVEVFLYCFVDSSYNSGLFIDREHNVINRDKLGSVPGIYP